MKAALGYAAVAFGAGASVVGITALLAGLQLHDAFLLRFGRRCVFAVMLAALAAAGVMEWALLTHDFSLRYVAENNAIGTPLLYTITGLWAALEGSILLWAVILGGYLTFVALKFRKRAADPLVVIATVTGLVVALFFFALMLGPANPFRELSTVPLDGRGPNPLLQNHVLMAFHPPILYLGYVGFTVPFMFGIAALVTGRFGEGWLADTRRATLVAWGFLTIGIILGAWWSYEVLGWGGFWAWDPVENASLLPVAHRHRLHPLGDRAGAARDAAGLEPVARHRDLLPHHPRHVPHPLGRDRLGARVHAVGHRAMAPRLPGRGGRDRHRSRRVARRPAARTGSHRLRGVARVGLPGQQPAVRRARVRGAARDGVPAHRRGVARVAACRWGSPTSTAWPPPSASRCSS